MQIGLVGLGRMGGNIVRRLMSKAQHKVVVYDTNPTIQSRICAMGQSYDLEMERRRLKREAYRLRQEAIRNGSYEAWRIARLLRDASNLEQIKLAERELALLMVNQPRPVPVTMDTRPNAATPQTGTNSLHRS